VTARAPRPLSPAQRDVLTAAEDGRVFRSLYSPTRWYLGTPWPGSNRAVTETYEALMRAGLLETGPFIALGTPRLAVVTDTGRRMLEQVRASAEEATR
jgi:hypothetical protein